MACNIILILAMIVFLLKYRKTMQTMLATFLQTNTKNTGIQSVQAEQVGRTYLPLFTTKFTERGRDFRQFKRNFHNGICCTGYYDYCMYSSCHYYHVFLLYKMQTYSHYIQILLPNFADFMYSMYVTSY